MRAKFEFELPEDRDDMILAFKGGQYYSCLFEIYNKCRDIEKYGENESKVELAEEILNVITERVDLFEVS